MECRQQPRSARPLAAYGDGLDAVTLGTAAGSATPHTTPGEGPTAALLRRLRDQENRPALVGYLPLGYPDLRRTLQALVTLADAGVDIIELGIPHTRPVMDGTVIQDAVRVALEQGTRTGHLFDAIAKLREHAPHVEVLVMTYWDPIAKYGPGRFARDLAAAGGAGLITPDLDPRRADAWIEASDQHGLDRVFLVAPDAGPENLAAATAASRGFVYAASVKGVTGARATIGERAEQLVKDTRAAGAAQVCVGLGVSTGEQAAEVGRWADGVIVGSVLVNPLLASADRTRKLPGGQELSDVSWTARLERMSTIGRELADGVRRARPVSEATAMLEVSHETTTKGARMTSTMPGNDEAIRSVELPEAIRTGAIALQAKAERITEQTLIEKVWAELDSRPGQYEDLREVLRKIYG